MRDQLPAQKRSDAFFCAERHEVLAWQGPQAGAHISAPVRLGQQLTEHAPQQACWYRLMLLIENVSWIYPPTVVHPFDSMAAPPNIRLSPAPLRAAACAQTRPVHTAAL